MAAAERHFSQARMRPEVLAIEADHDMRNSADFLVLNKLAKASSALKGLLSSRASLDPKARLSSIRPYLPC